MIFTRWNKVIDETATKVCMFAKPRPESMAIGHTYVYDAVAPDDLYYVKEDETEIGAVSTVYYTHGGWLTGDVCVEPDENVRKKYVVGNYYDVQNGHGRPAMRWMEDEYERPCAVDIATCKDVHSKKTIWETARTTPFHYDGKPHPNAYLDNEIGPRVQVRITNIDWMDVRKATDLFAHECGFESAHDLWIDWAQQHDRPAHDPLRYFKLMGDVGFRVEHQHKNAPSTFSHTAVEYLATRNAKFYGAWVLSFSLVNRREVQR